MEFTTREMLEFSSAAYDRKTWSRGGTEILVERGRRWIVVAFRGTEKDWRDIMTDLRGLPWWDRNLGWCHSGFLKRARASWGMVRHVVMTDDVRVYLTGHSLGGALATITAGMMVAAGKLPAGLVTFGAPAPSYDLRLARLLMWPGVARMDRHVNGADIVPTVPRLFGCHPGPARTWGPGHGAERMALPAWKVPFFDHRLAQYAAVLPA